MAANTAVLARAAQLVAPTAQVTHLGTGGFASTFKMTEPGGQVYALKVVDAQQSGAERTERELSALRKVVHPNVVGYRGTGTVGLDGVDYRWLSMTFVEGSTLAQLWASGRRWDLPSAVALLRHAVAGASAIWAQQTAHRDLSPNNLLVTPADELVIVDLGLARALDDETITVLPTPGTPGWMSPEQVGASPTHGDWRSDQYVLGLIGYWLITQTLPLTYRSRYEAWLAPAQQSPRSPRELDPNIPTALSDVIVKMLARAPHRRYLQPASLLADLDRAAAALTVTETTLQVQPQFLLTIGDKKSFAASSAFLTSVSPDALLIEPRARGRVAEFMDLTRAMPVTRIIDPRTHLARSPLQHRPVYFKELPFGADATLTGFSTPADRLAFCQAVTDFILEGGSEVVLAPYFFAGPGETVWVEESLRCATATTELLESRAATRGGHLEPVWTTVAVSQHWLGNVDARDQLLTLLTSQPMQMLHLLVHTTQQTFAPLGDRAILDGIVEVLTVMRDAGVPVTLGRRASEGLLGLAFGAAGWTTGVSGVQMNMAPHPEAAATGGPGSPRIYIPQLLTHVTTQTFVLWAATDPTLVTVTTAPGQNLLRRNPALERLSTEDGIDLLRHNVTAMRSQVSSLSGVTPAERRTLMRGWVDDAQRLMRLLPAPAGPGEGSGFLQVWSDLLG
ncbi:hypothetical protein GCM10009740_14170 [Terrabacter terrae]|uniref:Protein kinase domain-containing protein n=1 Tax=Terrabacter terrae TaxID=318434 RepID=A0ABN2U0C9_9MICO